MKKDFLQSFSVVLLFSSTSSCAKKKTQPEGMRERNMWCVILSLGASLCVPYIVCILLMFCVLKSHFNTPKHNYRLLYCFFFYILSLFRSEKSRLPRNMWHTINPKRNDCEMGGTKEKWISHLNNLFAEKKKKIRKKIWREKKEIPLISFPL